MDRKKVKVGMRVVVNDEPDATVYTVAEVEGFNAKLTYEIGGTTYSGGWLDVSCLKPSRR
jgi:hypothetical protein